MGEVTCIEDLVKFYRLTSGFWRCHEGRLHLPEKKKILNKCLEWKMEFHT